MKIPLKLTVCPNLTGEQNIVIHFNNICYSFNLLLPSGLFFTLYTVSNSFIHLSFYNLLSALIPPNPLPINNNKPNSPTIISTNSHNSFSTAKTVPNFPIDPSLGSNRIAALSPFYNMFSDSDNSFPPLFMPKIPAASPATPSWIQSEIPTLSLPPTVSKLKINCGYYFYLFYFEMNQLGANMHLFFGTTPPAYDTFRDVHNIIMASVCSIVLWNTYLEE
ncbi:hypothetical protein O181_111123 [Austropuccinia psidii MF-1]|uniref:Uncharacterized protein n=1 Tax=Austropuccinia psidii MF-1 TaxID=1389203 RepID=A0A9Q3JYZ1_9BASI|nr:hypothetical protein [Austropuccinia psidii MF-1]